jgi:uncharacterized repeat protein (TIGR01451 family)
VDCTATYTVTQADIEAGSVTNTATATGTPPAGVTPPVSPPSCATVPVDQTAALTVTKSASPTSVSAVGDIVTYTFHVTNTGNVPLSGVTIDEGSFTGTGMPPVVTCPPDTVPPAASVDCTATYTDTQADIDAGSVTNTATATGTPPEGVTPPVSPPSSVTEPVTQTAALTVVKSASPTVFTSPGTVITFSYEVTNTGNVTLTGVNVTDAMLGLSAISCPSTTLAPAESMTCTATYTTTQADMAHGSIENTASASAVDQEGAVVLSESSTVIIPGAPLAPVSPITPVTVPVTG